MRSSASFRTASLFAFVSAATAACDAFGVDSADEPDQLGTEDAGSMCGPPVDAASGSGTISGLANGVRFDSAATALWIGAPDSASTSVVFLLSQPIGCSELCSPGWDRRIRSDTQVLEMKTVGTSPGSYPAVPTPTPGPGQAVTSYTLSSTNGVPIEIVGSGGTVTLSAFRPSTSVSGTFALAFGSGEDLDGAFDAAFCPEGHEP